MMPLALLLCAAACGSEKKDAATQPGVVTNIMDQALPEARPADAPANGIAPVEAQPAIDTPPPSAAPDGLIPAAFQGRWTGEADRCGDRAAPLELTIAPDQLIFHESVGTVGSARAEADGRIAVDAAFTGEGQSWTRTLHMRRVGDRLIITNDGTAVTRKRC
ncbi:hypothetical protein [Sphingobium sp. CAP-1]|uniref:hypothetical protein n=1 Tax=Sphingobium sp. CAP-1 TaxID=2676077 RepID=UPI001E64FDAE|nr:hypothetical protein [Sphingobium sp. CAP-1]